uniref:Uncharacterized protein n=1 Tax=Anguilla anguilla TaxID=7936 RepID=A0A0E9U963_ANGAN
MCTGTLPHFTQLSMFPWEQQDSPRLGMFVCVCVIMKCMVS